MHPQEPGDDGPSGCGWTQAMVLQAADHDHNPREEHTMATVVTDTSDLFARIIWIIDGYRFGYFDMAESLSRIDTLVDHHRELLP